MSTTDEIIASYRELSCASVSDALDALGLAGTVLGIAPLFDTGTVVGRAFTVGYGPTGRPPGSVGDFVDDVEPGGVVVIDNDGRLDCTVWGGLMTTVASRRGVAATVINGVCRDVATARELRYPMFTAGRFMRTGKDRVELRSLGEPVSLGTVKVRPGDLVFGDADGVLVVPREHEVEVLEKARAVAAAEEAILAQLGDGGSLRAARAAYSYHTLQRQR